MLFIVTIVSRGASSLAANVSFTFWNCISSNRGFLGADSSESSADLLIWVGISNGADLSILADAAVSPLRYANTSFLSGRVTTGIFSACKKSQN